TEEFHPGFRNSTASYTVSLLNPQVINDLHLHDHGLRIIERPLANFVPLPDGRYLKSGGTLADTQAEFAKFSRRDAERLPAYSAMLERVAAVLRDIATMTPPNAGGGLADLWQALKLARKLGKLDLVGQRDVLDLFTKSATEVLNSWFESDAVKALFGFDAVVGNFASPDTPGSAYVLLHHVFGEVNGKSGVWGHAIGGMGAITQAMQAEAQALGVDISLNAPVAEVLVSKGRVTGVRLESGEEITARRVIANVNPKLLFQKLVPTETVDDDFNQRMKNYVCASATLRMNVALDALPDFTALPGAGKHLSAGIIMAPSLDYMDQAYQDARQQGFARQPIVEMLIPSTIDDSLAPAGKHVASLFCQHFNPELPDNKNWDDLKEQAAQTVIDTVTRYAPNFKQSIIGKLVLTPLDLERRFGLIGGDIFHGRLSLDQLFSARPILGHGNYRMPLKGLYLCGSGTHPGGGVTGLPGRNAAREILRDR
ncbi:MAG TPA: NAD(P)/FAD-dependent oxidoreductase, partial [Gammaproteobacteria bacterium]|nr:NAD(P)/FAD-dependent oxidoreductase [Gammaproteobacteria bacterium]